MGQSAIAAPLGPRRLSSNWGPLIGGLVSLLLAIVLLFLAPVAHAGGVGFQELRIEDGANKPLTIGVWYPTDAPTAPTPLLAFTQDVAADGPVSGEALPLVVMSHGTGGWYGEHDDTALALAHAGFVVAAVTHTGDNIEDRTQAAAIWTRSSHIQRLIDYMLAEWPDYGRIDPAKVGMFGFSAGGFTTLVVAGGTPDLTRVIAHCQAHPDYFDCGVVKNAGGVAALTSRTRSLSPSVWVHDPRVKAAVVAAPALGFTFGPEGLANVRVPIQLWRVEDDHILPNPDYAEAVRIALPQPPEYHVVPNADHFDFLAPCSALLASRAPQICTERPGFDRAAFHESFNAQVVEFFERALK